MSVKPFHGIKFVTVLCLQQTVAPLCLLSDVHSHHPEEKTVLHELSTAEEKKETLKGLTYM